LVRDTDREEFSVDLDCEEFDGYLVLLVILLLLSSSFISPFPIASW